MLMDNEFLRLWQLVHELGDQLAHNQKITSALQSEAEALKVGVHMCCIAQGFKASDRIKRSIPGTGLRFDDIILISRKVYSIRYRGVPPH
jgi:hypothetical protein